KVFARRRGTDKVYWLLQLESRHKVSDQAATNPGPLPVEWRGGLSGWPSITDVGVSRRLCRDSGRAVVQRHWQERGEARRYRNQICWLHESARQLPALCSALRSQ